MAIIGKLMAKKKKKKKFGYSHHHFVAIFAHRLMDILSLFLVVCFVCKVCLNSTLVFFSFLTETGHEGPAAVALAF